MRCTSCLAHARATFSAVCDGQASIDKTNVRLALQGASAVPSSFTMSVRRSAVTQALFRLKTKTLSGSNLAIRLTSVTRSTAQLPMMICGRAFCTSPLSQTNATNDRQERCKFRDARLSCNRRCLRAHPPLQAKYPGLWAGTSFTAVSSMLTCTTECPAGAWPSRKFAQRQKAAAPRQENNEKVASQKIKKSVPKTGTFLVPSPFCFYLRSHQNWGHFRFPFWGLVGWFFLRFWFIFCVFFASALPPGRRAGCLKKSGAPSPASSPAQAFAQLEPA